MRRKFTGFIVAAIAALFGLSGTAMAKALCERCVTIPTCTSTTVAPTTTTTAPEATTTTVDDGRTTTTAGPVGVTIVVQVPGQPAPTTTTTVANEDEADTVIVNEVSEVRGTRFAVAAVRATPTFTG